MHDITVTGFRQVPPFAQGLVRDLRVRWALEEAGLPYEVSIIDFAEKDSDAYRRRTAGGCSSPAPSCCRLPKHPRR